MQNNTELKSLQKRFKALDDEMAPHVDAFDRAQTGILISDERAQQRNIDLRKAKVFALITPTNFRLFIDAISALKALHAFISPCTHLYHDISDVLENSETIEDLNDLRSTLKNTMFCILASIKTYKTHYKSCKADVREGLHAAFAEHPQLVAWFSAQLNPPPAPQPPSIQQYFQKSCVPFGVGIAESSEESEEDIEEVLDEAMKKFKRIMLKFPKWKEKIANFSKEIEKTNDDYKKQVETCAHYSRAFVKMRIFIQELRHTTRELDHYLNHAEIIGNKREKIKSQIAELNERINVLEEKLENFCNLIRNLAQGFEANRESLTELLCKFMQPWLSNLENNPLKASAKIMRSHYPCDKTQQEQIEITKASSERFTK
jgi:hypothetical protein